MKKVISALTVAAMCASMAASAMPAFAIYKGGEVGSYLKVVSADKGTISEDGKTITFATAADAANAKITIDQFLVCDVESVSLQKINCAFTADNTAITLGDGVNLNSEKYSAQDVEYTVNGKTFKTKCMVNCFAWLTKRGAYKSGCGASQMNSSTEGTSKLVGKGDNTFVVTAWNSDFGDTVNYPDTYKETAHFMDTKSDSLPFMEFSAKIDSTIADGTYTVDFLPEYQKDGETTQGCFIITGDGKTTVSFGDLEGITIKVGDAKQPDTTEPKQPDTTEPKQPDTTEPQQPDTTEPQPVGNYNWYIEDTVYDLQTGDGWAIVPLKVSGDNDPGRVGYEFKLLIDGKEVSKSKLHLDEIEAQDAYEMTAFLPNVPVGVVGASYDDGNNPVDLVAANGSTVVNFVFEITDDIKAGDKFELSVTSVNGGNMAGDDVKITVKSGTLTITDGDTPIDTTEPKQPDTTDPKQPDTTNPKQPDTTEPGPGTYLYGDADENGKVELLDIVTLNRYLTGYDDQKLTARGIVNANCFRNGESDADTTAKNLDGKDSMEILKYLIKLVTTLPTQG